MAFDLLNETETTMYLKMIANKIIHIQDKLIAPYGLTSQQARLLVIIDHYSKKKYQMCQKELEQIMQLKGSSITSLLKSLERKGFLFRCAANTDARKKHLRITDKGQEVVSEMNILINQTEESISYSLSKEEKEQFRQMLKKIYRSIS